MATTVTTQQGDTWDILSYRVYGDEHYMEELIKANIARRNVAFFSAGITLSVPEINTTDTAVSSLPPWKTES